MKTLKALFDVLVSSIASAVFISVAANSTSIVLSSALIAVVLTLFGRSVINLGPIINKFLDKAPAPRPNKVAPVKQSKPVGLLDVLKSIFDACVFSVVIAVAISFAVNATNAVFVAASASLAVVLFVRTVVVVGRIINRLLNKHLDLGFAE